MLIIKHDTIDMDCSGSDGANNILGFIMVRLTEGTEGIGNRNKFKIKNIHNFEFPLMHRLSALRFLLSFGDTWSLGNELKRINTIVDKKKWLSNLSLATWPTQLGPF